MLWRFETLIARHRTGLHLSEELLSGSHSRLFLRENFFNSNLLAMACQKQGMDMLLDAKISYTG